MIRAGLFSILLLLAGCSFQGTGLAPFRPAPVVPAEDDLEVPYVPTPRPVVEAMLDLAAVGPSDYLIDLGSGDGRIAIASARRGGRALGVDIDPDRIAEGIAAARLAGVETRALFRRQDLFATPIADANVVSMYLLPGINMRLRPRLLTELRPGARIVTHAFTLGDWRPDAHRVVDGANIYLWIVPAVAGGQWSLSGLSAEPAQLELEQQFQDVTGTLLLGGRALALRDVALSGRRLSFTIDLPGGARSFRGIVGENEIVPDPGDAPAGWRARRVG